MTLEELEKMEPEQIRKILEEEDFSQFDEIHEEIRALEPEDENAISFMYNVFFICVSSMPGMSAREQVEALTPHFLKLFDYWNNKDQSIESPKGGIVECTAISTDKIDYPLDKPNDIIWRLLKNSDNSEQLSFSVDTGGKRQRLNDSLVLCSIDFTSLPSNVKLSKELTPFDKRIYVSAAALWNATKDKSGNAIITATQIYKTMGGIKHPSKNDFDKIIASIDKMRMTQITIDNDPENTATKGGYNHFRYAGALLPNERIEALVNGKTTECAINLFAEPPLVRFARERKQISTITTALLRSPISMTNSNLLLEDYLLQRILRMKRNKSTAASNILFKTLYTSCNITTSCQKSRLPDKLKRILNHYKEEDFIKDYKITDREIIIGAKKKIKDTD